MFLGDGGILRTLSIAMGHFIDRRTGEASAAVRAVSCLLLLALTALIVLPPSASSSEDLWRSATRITDGEDQGALPALSERHERKGDQPNRVVQVTLPASFNASESPSTDASIFPVGGEPDLPAHFVYTQTTSSRL